MAEKVDERFVQVGTSGACFVSIPKSYREDLGVGRGTVMECFREGDTISYRPKQAAEKDPAKGGR